MIGKTVKEMKWVMRMNESAETKGKCCHGKRISLRMSKDRGVELEANHRSYGSPAIAHKRAEHSAHKLIDWINLRLVHHKLYCAT